MLHRKLAYLIGNYFPEFKGKNRLIRSLYPPDKHLNDDKGHIFIKKYFNTNYEGITSNFIDWGIYFLGGLEKQLVKYTKRFIYNDYQYLFDIGANSGTFSLPFNKLEKINIVCFEPMLHNFIKLKNNYLINNAYKNVKLFNIALSDKKTNSVMHYPNNHEHFGQSSLEKNWQEKNIEKIKIKTDLLDNLYTFKNKKIFLKIDVEGHENKVLKGCTKLLENNKFKLYLETEDRHLVKILKKRFDVYNFFINEKTADIIDTEHPPHYIVTNMDKRNW